MATKSLHSLKSVTRRTIVAGIIAAGGMALLGVSASYATHAGPSTVCDGEAPEFTVGGLTPDFSPAAVFVGGVQVGTLPNDMGDHHYTAPVGTPNTFTVVVQSPPNDKHADTFVREFPMTAVPGDCETTTTETPTTETSTTETSTTETPTTETHNEECPVVVAGRASQATPLICPRTEGATTTTRVHAVTHSVPTTTGIAESETTAQVVVTLPRTGSDVRHTAWLPAAGAAAVATGAVLQLSTRRRKAA